MAGSAVTVMVVAALRHLWGCVSEDERVVKELQDAQTRTALLGFLHSKAFFGELSKLLGG
ncbi:unnamed protein product, partial [Ectocarpus fasciculatus]